MKPLSIPGFVPFKGRRVAPRQKVKAYWNLHKDVWSLVALDGPDKGRVLGHCPRLGLLNAKFVVSESGRQRVIREKKKNVHAFAIGRLLSAPDCHLKIQFPVRPLSYNPYKAAHFVVRASGEPIHGTDVLLLDEGGRATASAA